MNTQTVKFSPEMDRFGRRVAHRLDQAADDVPYEITERLRAARVRALASRSLAVEAAPAVVVSGGEAALHMGPLRPHRWGRLASVIPLLALLAGLVAIHWIQEDMRAAELAEIDAELLTDDLPPEAFTDPGFAHFLRKQQAQ